MESHQSSEMDHKTLSTQRRTKMSVEPSRRGNPGNTDGRILTAHRAVGRSMDGVRGGEGAPFCIVGGPPALSTAGEALLWAADGSGSKATAGIREAIHTHTPARLATLPDEIPRRASLQELVCVRLRSPS